MAHSGSAIPSEDTASRPGPAGRHPARPRILLITDYLPQHVASNVHGAFQRLHRHVQSLQRLGELDIVFLWPWHPDSWTAESEANLDELRRGWLLSGHVERVVSRYTCQVGLVRIALPSWLEGFAGRVWRGNAGTVAAVAAFAERTKPDLVFAHRMGAILPAARALAQRYPVIADFDDVEHVRMQRQAAHLGSWRKRLRLGLVAWLTRRLEREALARVRLALVCSEADADFLRPLPQGARLALLPNAADEQPEQPAPDSTATALFIGMVRYWPNAEGLVWMAREVWPLVRKIIPEARLVLAGLGSDELGLADAAAGIEAKGFVAELAPLYGAARIALCPLRIASGTRIKIIEAAMHGRPVVSTTIGAEGLNFENGRDIVLADDAAAFAQACVGLLRDPEKTRAMGLAARDRARSEYGPTPVHSRLAAICRDALEAAVGAIRPPPAGIR